MKGHSYSPSGCPKCGKVHVNPFKGEAHSDNWKKDHGYKVSQSLKGKNKSDLHKKRLSVSNTGKMRSEATKVNVLFVLNWVLVILFTEKLIRRKQRVR